MDMKELYDMHYFFNTVLFVVASIVCVAVTNKKKQEDEITEVSWWCIATIISFGFVLLMDYLTVILFTQ